MPSPTFIIECVAIAVATAFISFAATRETSLFAQKHGAVDAPTGGRKIHQKATPLWGGLGIAVSVLLLLGVLEINGLFSSTDLRPIQLMGFAVAIFILMVGGAIDDRWPLPPIAQLVSPILAAIIVVASGTGIVQVANPIQGGVLSLSWLHLGPISLPADLLTIAWLFLATYATKLLDGLDGLVTGIAVIGAGMVGALTLSPTYFQPSVALLSSVIGGGFLGFLPRNFHPAKQFLGEAGSTLAGFTLGFLAVVSSAKVAIALAVLAIPVTDALLVVFGRVMRGVPPWKADDSHLHFRLLRTGIPHPRVVLLLWAVSFAAGIMALSLQTRGKMFLVATLIVLTALASWLAQRLARRIP
ncbi:MAG: MraY family glycosyltransferase [Patescibacteria group bacterium]